MPVNFLPGVEYLCLVSTHIFCMVERPIGCADKIIDVVCDYILISYQSHTCRIGNFKAADFYRLPDLRM